MLTNEVIITSLFIFALAGFLGLELIRRVPKLLHTPLMALTNALSAISLVGSLLILGETETTYAEIMGFVAVVASTINVVGGFLITDQKPNMFHLPEPAKPSATALERSRTPSGASMRSRGSRSSGVNSVAPSSAMRARNSGMRAASSVTPAACLWPPNFRNSSGIVSSAASKSNAGMLRHEPCATPFSIDSTMAGL